MLEQSHSAPNAQVHVQTGSEYLQGQRLHHLPGQPVPVLITLTVKKFPDVQREPPAFQPVPIASGPVTGHHVKDPAIPPSSVPSANLLRLHSAPSFSPLTKPLNSLGHSTDLSGYWPSTRFCTTDYPSPGPAAQFSTSLPAFQTKDYLPYFCCMFKAFKTAI